MSERNALDLFKDTINHISDGMTHPDQEIALAVVALIEWLDSRLATTEITTDKHASLIKTLQDQVVALQPPA